MKAGYVNPVNLLFAKTHVTRVRDVSAKVHEDIDAIDRAYAEIHRNHPFQPSPDFVAACEVSSASRDSGRFWDPLRDKEMSW